MRLRFEGGPLDMRILSSDVENPPPNISYGLDEPLGVYICSSDASNANTALYRWREPEWLHAARNGAADEAAE